MRVVHVANTPVAGSPARIVRALREHTDVEADLVVLRPDAYGTRTFSGGLSWESDREVALDLMSRADVLHLHQSIDVHSNGFGIDFEKTFASRSAIIRQFHSVPRFLAGGDTGRAQAIADSELPHLVICNTLSVITPTPELSRTSSRSTHHFTSHSCTAETPSVFSLHQAHQVRPGRPPHGEHDGTRRAIPRHEHC